MLVGGAGVVFQHTGQSGALVFRHFAQKRVGANHLQSVFLCRVRESAPGVGVGVHIGQIRLDVEDRRAVQKVRAADDQLAVFDARQLHAGKPQRVRAVGAAGRKDAAALVAAQARRAHGGPPAFARGILCRHGGKLPDQPQPVIPLDADQRVRVTVFRLKHDARRQLRHQPALPRDAEFIRKIRADMRNRMNCVLHGNVCPLFVVYYIGKEQILQLPHLPTIVEIWYNM